MRSVWSVVFILGACGFQAPQQAAPPLPPLMPGGTGGAQTTSFAQVVARVEPVAEAECRRMAPQLNCDFLIMVDDQPGLGANAYQKLSLQGRPIIGFTPKLIEIAQSNHELAFVLSHEAAHHIRGHLMRQNRDATIGAVVLGGVAGVLGANAGTVQSVQKIGATVGARSYSKAYELEADSLGAEIAIRAGYDPLIGISFFQRIPDPGDQFLGTHPPNAARLQIVRQTVAAMGR